MYIHQIPLGLSIYEKGRLEAFIAISKDFKGRVSLLFYLIGIALALVNVWISCACYFEVAIMWLIPDRRIEQQTNYK